MILHAMTLHMHIIMIFCRKGTSVPSDEHHWFSEKVILLELTYACEAKVGGACVSRDVISPLKLADYI